MQLAATTQSRNVALQLIKNTVGSCYAWMSLPSVHAVHMQDTGRPALCPEDLASEDGFTQVLSIDLILLLLQ